MVKVNEKDARLICECLNIAKQYLEESTPANEPTKAAINKKIKLHCFLKKYDIIKIENRSALMYCFKAERANRLSFFIKSCIKK